MLSGIWLIVLGIMAAPNLLLSRKPEAKEYLDKLVPYQGWFGAISALWGAWQIIQALLNIRVFGHWPVLYLTWVAYAVCLLGLGLLLGVGVMKSFVKNPDVTEKLDQTIARLAPHQGRLGMLAIGLGIWAVVANLLYR